MKTMKTILLVLSLLVGSQSYAGTAFLTGKVIRILQNDGQSFGGCMVQFDRQVSSVGLDCLKDFVTFSCSGDFMNKADASRLFESAQLAMILDKFVTVQVTDQRKHNGFCFANRIDNFQ